MLLPEAKKLLAETIRGTAQNADKGLRAKLLGAVHSEADSRYRLSLTLAKAGLDEAHQRRRERIEEWVDVRARATKPKNKTELKAAQAHVLQQAEKEAAATLLNRLILLRHLEAVGLSKPAVLTGGWNSRGYQEFRAFAPGLTGDETEGYATLLRMLFDELAVDLPGLFGDVGLTSLFAIPAATLREIVERLDVPGLASAWTDDTTLGWVYQYWNDPDREALDAKISDGGKIEPHEIASKTQMFTERYMVEWLLQNSLGLTWLAMCKKHGWVPDAERVLPSLEARRVAWRTRREAGEVALDALMPIEGELEEQWKYYVPQPIPDDAVEKAPESVRTLKILDPACGSGHFLVIAFGMLASLYREEARHRGEVITDRAIAESILENNLHGIDIDPRAIQIAAAGLYLKAKLFAKDARPKAVNLVAPILKLGNLPADDPAVVRLREELKRDVGIPVALTNRLLTSLAGVDYLGSLFKVDAALNDAIVSDARALLVSGEAAARGRRESERVKLALIDKLEQFVARRSKSGDLGLRLDGEQVAAGVRFVRMAREGTYDVVVGNPPYHGTAKLRDAGYFVSQYPEGRADLFVCFYLRGLELLRHSGTCAFITLSNWTTLSVYRDFRTVVRRNALVVLAELGKAAFTTGGTLISTTGAILKKSTNVQPSCAIRPHAPDEIVRDDGQPARTEAALLLHRGRYDFDPRGFEVIEGEPIVYWWSKEFLERYAAAPKLGDGASVKNGANTGANGRLTRFWWEVDKARLQVERHQGSQQIPMAVWAPYIMGGQDRAWIEPLRTIINWCDNGLEAKAGVVNRFGDGGLSWKICSQTFYFKRGVAFSSTGARFRARVHRFASVFDMKGQSVFCDDIEGTCCLMNSSVGREVLESLNPTISFQVGDALRLPMFPDSETAGIFAVLHTSFGEHESHRETSYEFSAVGRSSWRSAQLWAQASVDRSSGAALRKFDPIWDPPDAISAVSHAIGIILGRCVGSERAINTVPPTPVGSGMLFIGTGGHTDLDQPACSELRARWREHEILVSESHDLSTYLRKSFFEYHRTLYENRPIYFPLSSSKKSFVAFVSIHRWKDDTLNVLLADHLVPTKRHLDGELEDIRKARTSGANKSKSEKRFTEVQKLLEELNEFIAKVSDIAAKGPSPSDDKTRKREVDARYVMDLDDGVMVNSAALWPLLEPQWKDPKKWWKELANAQGKKDYDWSHLAARYFPKRALDKCHGDPSLAVAHKRFWDLHPAKAYAWELRLQDEIRPDFTIDEPESNAARKKFLKDHKPEAAEILADEKKRRERKAAKADDEFEARPLVKGKPRDDDETDELETPSKPPPSGPEVHKARRIPARQPAGLLRAKSR